MCSDDHNTFTPPFSNILKSVRLASGQNVRPVKLREFERATRPSYVQATRGGEAPNNRLGVTAVAACRVKRAWIALRYPSRPKPFKSVTRVPRKVLIAAVESPVSFNVRSAAP
jgi:hypothetical protein